MATTGYDKEFERELRKQLAAKGWHYRQPRAAYDAASSSRLNASWVTSRNTGDSELRGTLSKMRDRSRDSAQNDPYMRKFLSMCRKNIVGPSGIGFQSKVKNPDGTLDSVANTIIEAGFSKWGRPENCTVDGETSWQDLQREICTDVPRDGEHLIRMVRGYDNPFRFSLQLLEADYLDETYETRLANGNRVIMGKEFNPWGRCVAFYLLEKHPGDSFPYGVSGRRTRVPAEEIIHVFVRERRTQNRGIPWAFVALPRLHQLREYEMWELVAAREGAGKLGFIKEEPGEGWDGTYTDEATGETITAGDAVGNVMNKVEAGSWYKLPKAMSIEKYDPNHPNQAFPDFLKAMLRGFCSGVDINYNFAASDLEGVNFSSLRSGALDERDAWKMLQSWLISKVCQPIYENWLQMALLSGALQTASGKALPLRQFEKFNAPKWGPRRWDWVDPEKDVNAQNKELARGTTTLTRLAAEKGEDIEDILIERAQEIRMIEDIGKRYQVDLAKHIENPEQIKSNRPQLAGVPAGGQE